MHVTYIYVCVHAYNEQTPRFCLTLLPTFNICKLLRGHTRLQHLNQKVLISHEGIC